MTSFDTSPQWAALQITRNRFLVAWCDWLSLKPDRPSIDQQVRQMGVLMQGLQHEDGLPPP